MNDPDKSLCNWNASADFIVCKNVTSVNIGMPIKDRLTKTFHGVAAETTTVNSTSETNPDTTTGTTEIVDTSSALPSPPPIDPALTQINCSVNDSNFTTQFHRDDKIVNVTHENGSIFVYVTSFPGNYVLIWYENLFPRQIHTKTISTDLIQCIGSHDGYYSIEDDDNGNEMQMSTKKIALNSKLMADKTYIFCMAKRNSLLISPLNCISYEWRTETESHLWLAQEKRFQLIVTIIVVYIFTVFVGILLLHFLIRKIKEFQNRQMVTVVHSQCTRACQ